MKKKKRNLEDKLNKYLIEKASLPENIEVQKENIEKLKQEIDELKKELKTSLEDISNHKTSVVSLEKEKAVTFETIKNQKENIEKLNQEANALKEKLNVKIEEISEHKTVVASLKQEKEAFSEDYKLKEENIEKLKQKIDELKKELKTSLEDISNHKTSVVSLEKEKAVTFETIKNQKENIEKLNQKINDTDKQLKDKLNELSECEKANVTLQEANKYCEQEKHNLVNQISELKGKLGGIEQQQGIENSPNVLGVKLENHVYETMKKIFTTYEKITIEQQVCITNNAADIVAGNESERNRVDFLLSFYKIENQFETKNINFRLIIECKNGENVTHSDYKQLISYCRKTKAELGILLCAIPKTTFEVKRDWNQFKMTKNSNDATIFLVNVNDLTTVLFFLAWNNDKYKANNVNLTTSEKTKDIVDFMKKYKEFFENQETTINSMTVDIGKIKIMNAKIAKHNSDIEKFCDKNIKRLNSIKNNIEEKQIEIKEIPKLLESNLINENEPKIISMSEKTTLETTPIFSSEIKEIKE